MGWAAFVVAMLAVAAVLGFLVGRWWFVLLATLVWPIIALGLWAGWWGNGFGEDTPVLVMLGLFALYTLSVSVGAGCGMLVRLACAGRRRVFGPSA